MEATPEPAAPVVPDAPTAPDDEPTAEEKQAVADCMEQLMLEVQADEENWQLDDRLDYQLKKTG